MAISDYIKNLNPNNFVKILMQNDEKGRDLNKMFDYFDMSNSNDRKYAVFLLDYMQEKDTYVNKETLKPKRNSLEDEIYEKSRQLSKVERLAVSFTGGKHTVHSLKYEMSCRGLSVESMIQDYSSYSVNDKKGAVKVFRALGLYGNDGNTEISEESLRCIDVESQYEKKRIGKSYSLEKKMPLLSPQPKQVRESLEKKISTPIPATKQEKPNKSLWGKVKDKWNSFKNNTYDTMGFSYAR